MTQAEKIDTLRNTIFDKLQNSGVPHADASDIMFLIVDYGSAKYAKGVDDTGRLFNGVQSELDEQK